MTSNNSFAKKSFTKSSNSFAKKTFSKSSNTMAIRVFSKGSNVWNGENLSGGAAGLGDAFGGPDSTYGIGEYGGISHFLVKKQTGTISH